MSKLFFPFIGIKYSGDINDLIIAFSFEQGWWVKAFSSEKIKIDLSTSLLKLIHFSEFTLFDSKTYLMGMT